MKRGGPLQRTTPLRAKTRLAAGKPLSRSKAMSASQKRRATRRRQAVRAGDGVHGDLSWRDVRIMIHVRACGCCEGCGGPIALDGGLEGHHRLTRRLGPDCPCNALALCRVCHHGPTVHGGPVRARELGRIISRHDDRQPDEVPVDVHGRGVVTLTCQGSYAAA